MTNSEGTRWDQFADWQLAFEAYHRITESLIHILVFWSAEVQPIYSINLQRLDYAIHPTVSSHIWPTEVTSASVGLTTSPLIIMGTSVLSWIPSLQLRGTSSSFPLFTRSHCVFFPGLCWGLLSINVFACPLSLYVQNAGLFYRELFRKIIPCTIWFLILLASETQRFYNPNWKIC